ncbi:DUF2000 domain-containing protein, partial [Cronobacter sakazakii]
MSGRLITSTDREKNMQFDTRLHKCT